MVYRELSAPGTPEGGADDERLLPAGADVRQFRELLVQALEAPNPTRTLHAGFHHAHYPRPPLMAPRPVSGVISVTPVAGSLRDRLDEKCKIIDALRSRAADADPAAVTAAYNAVERVAIDAATRIVELERKAVPEPRLTMDSVFARLMGRVNRVILELLTEPDPMRDPGCAALMEEVSERLEDATGSFRLTADLADALSATGRAQSIDIALLPTTSLRIERGDALLTKDRKQELEIFKSAIDKGFDVPHAGDLFAADLADPDVTLVSSVCEDDVIAFFTAKRMPDGTCYIDSVCAGENHAGLAEATLLSGLRRLDAPAGFRLVSKPEVLCFRIMIENFHGIAWKQTDAGQYHHRYSELETLTPGDAVLSRGKSLGSSELAAAIAACDAGGGKLVPLDADGKLFGCRVIFRKGSRDGGVQELADRLYRESGLVLSRFVPQRVSVMNRTYYCVFEPDMRGAALAVGS